MSKARRNRVENGTENLDRVVGTEWTATAKSIQSEITQLSTELRKLFRQGHTLRRFLKSSEYVCSGEYLLDAFGIRGFLLTSS